MKTTKTKRRALTKKQRDKVYRAILHHEHYKTSWWWTPPGNASSRRAMERVDSIKLKFKHCGVAYLFESDVRCSGRNVYYTGKFFMDGEKKTVRAFKSLLEKKGELS